MILKSFISLITAQTVAGSSINSRSEAIVQLDSGTLHGIRETVDGVSQGFTHESQSVLAGFGKICNKVKMI